MASYHAAVAQIDQSRAALHEIIRKMEDRSPGFIARTLDDLEHDIRHGEPGERLFSHAAYIGLLMTMQHAIEAKGGG